MCIALVGHGPKLASALARVDRDDGRVRREVTIEDAVAGGAHELGHVEGPVTGGSAAGS